MMWKSYFVSLLENSLVICNQIIFFLHPDYYNVSMFYISLLPYSYGQMNVCTMFAYLCDYILTSQEISFGFVAQIRFFFISFVSHTYTNFSYFFFFQTSFFYFHWQKLIRTKCFLFNFSSIVTKKCHLT